MSDSAAFASKDSGAPLRQLCAELFLAPQRLIKAHVFPAATRVRPQAPHQHEDWLQLDFALGCEGRWIVDGASREVHGPTICAFYPGQWHHYEVVAQKPGARIFSVKFCVGNSWPAIAERVFCAHQTQLNPVEPLQVAWERLIRVTSSGDATAQALRLCELLCLWPCGENGSAWPVLQRNDAPVETAIQHIERHLDRMMPLEEMAALVHLSPRHFARRFQAACGQSPAAYANARRVALAGEWLLEESLPVAQISAHLGFSSVPAFSRWFKAQSGFSPRSWRQKKNAHVGFG
jgi:AraC-like DNA-binding protein